MSETLQPRTYVPLAAGYDPYTFARGGGPAHLFFNRPVVRAPEQTAEVTVTAAGGSEGDFRLPPVMFIPDAPGQRTIGNTQGGTYVQNPDAVPFSPSTGSISQDLANIANIPGLTGAINSVLTGGPAGALSVLGGTALSSLTSDPRVTTITGGLGDLYREAQLTPEERAARQETRRDLDAMTDRDIMNRFGITVEDLPDLQNIATTYQSEDETPAPALENIATTYGPEVGGGAVGTTAPTGAPGTGNFAQDLASFLSEPAIQDAALGFGLGALSGGIGPGIAAATRGAMSAGFMDALADALGLTQSKTDVDMTPTVDDTLSIANPEADIGSFGISDPNAAAAAAAAAAQAEANAAAANVDADAQATSSNNDTSPSTSTDSNTSTDSGPSGPGEGSADGSAYREGGLVQFAQGGVVALEGGGKIAIGPGGGLDDLIPTSINGRRAAALSDGEFVIPADVVSMMGDGSSNAGARRLYDLVKQIRQNKTGTAKQAGPLPAGEILKRTLGR